MNCICNNEILKSSRLPFYEVTTEGKTVLSEERMNINVCQMCGVHFQGATIDYAEYPPTKSEYQIKNYDHDLIVAEKRFDYYKQNGVELNESSRCLDIGSGSGAFIGLVRSNGIEIVGCEIAKYADAQNQEFVYHDRFEDIHFPVDYFDVVFCHDVLEHVQDPELFLKEAFRTTKQNGKFILEFPDFWGNEGKHHWKKEHIWYFTTEQLRMWLNRVGFDNVQISKPIPSKILFICNKPKQKRIKILFPPGVGDSYWSITKTQAFINRLGYDVADAYVVCPREKKYNGHERAFPFIELFSFLHSTGKAFDSSRNKNLSALWKEAYAERGRTIIKDVFGCNYFISYNGHLRYGENLEKLNSDLKTDWFYPMFKSLEWRNMKKFKEEHGKYIVFYFIFQGTYQHWTNEFSLNYIVQSIRKLTDETGFTPVFVGANWDADENTLKRVKSAIPNMIDMVGKTTIPEVFGLIENAEMLVGFPSGLSILSAILKTKTLIIWNNYYNKDFFWNCLPKETHNNNYFIENTFNLTPERLVNRCVSILNDDTGEKEVIEKKDLDNSITIYCVLKSGGVYKTKDVTVLKSMLQRNTTYKFEFKCISDMRIKDKVAIKNNWPGWWSKIELFYHNTGPALYFDLDTVIIKNIDNMLLEASKLKKGEFRMLIPFNDKRRSEGHWASGIMAWNGDFKSLLNLTNTQISEIGMDQTYIEQVLKRIGVTIKPINDWTKVYSHKRHCQDHLPDNADIVCFHGRIKPKDVKDQWIVENYR